MNRGPACEAVAAAREDIDAVYCNARIAPSIPDFSRRRDIRKQQVLIIVYA
jgi:hypothetical protein